MKILESYKKMAKSMLMEHAWDRKFGEPLPTLDDIMNEASQDDEDYVHIGYGKYKDKDHVDDPTAPTFKKDDSGAFVPAKGGDKEKEPGDDKEKPEEPKGKALGKGDFERDFDDDPTRGDPDDAWDDEEGRAKPTGKTDADTDDDSVTGKDYVSKFTGTGDDDEDEAVRSFADEYKETEENEGESAAMDSIDDNIDDYIVDTLKIKRDTSEYEEKFDKMKDEVWKQIEGEEESNRTGRELETITINGKQYREIRRD